jgi:hypothetical protein
MINPFLGSVKVIHMKSVAGCVQWAIGLGTVAAIGIAATWSQALAQSPPGAAVNSVPEPSSLALMATGVVVVAAFYKFRKRNRRP